MTELEQVWVNTFKDMFPFTVEDNGSLRVTITQGHPMKIYDFTLFIRKIIESMGRRIRTEVVFDDDGVYMLISLSDYTPVDPEAVEPIEAGDVTDADESPEIPTGVKPAHVRKKKAEE